MAIPPELYGPFGALAVLSFVVLALIRGDLVPGFIYRQERDKRSEAEARETKTAEALTVLAKAAAKNGARTPAKPRA